MAALPGHLVPAIFCRPQQPLAPEDKQGFAGRFAANREDALSYPQLRQISEILWRKPGLARVKIAWEWGFGGSECKRLISPLESDVEKRQNSFRDGKELFLCATGHLLLRSRASPG